MMFENQVEYWHHCILARLAGRFHRAPFFSQHIESMPTTLPPSGCGSTYLDQAIKSGHFKLISTRSISLSSQYTGRAIPNKLHNRMSMRVNDSMKMKNMKRTSWTIQLRGLITNHMHPPHEKEDFGQRLLPIYKSPQP